MSGRKPARAACLTPPAAGGVAVIQVIGPDAPEILTPYLAARRPLDLPALRPDELRLCGFVQAGETIDDVLICARHGPENEWIIDLNLHGGPRIVERVLMALRDAGVQITPPGRLLDVSWSSCDSIEREAMHCLLEARTRSVGQWLLRARDALVAALEQCTVRIEAGDLAASREILNRTTSAGFLAPWLLRGARVVVTGRPNAGKSSLVNRLAEREQILVSPLPGTTRDFVEQPTAIDGVPILLVDTAGVRATSDELESEAIARTRLQLRTADLILHLTDASRPPGPLDDEPDVNSNAGTSSVMRVLSKIDLAIDPEMAVQMGDRGTWQVSSVTGQGLPDLRRGILETLGLWGWSERLPAAFTSRQVSLLRAAERELTNDPPAIEAALTFLRKCRSGPLPPCDALPSAGI